MSLPAVQVSASPPPTSANHQPDAAAKSGAGAAFAAVFSALAGETAQPKTQSGSTKDAPTTDSRDPRRKEASTSEDAASIDANLAGLVLGALPAVAQFAPPGAGAAARSATISVSSTTAIMSAMAQGASPRGPLWRAQTGQIAAANASGSTGAAKSASSADPTIAALASAAAKSVGPSFANAGAVPSPQAVPLTEAQLKAAEQANNGQTAINFSVVRNRTHLGVDDAAQTVAKDPVLRAQWTTGAASQAGAIQPLAAVGAAPALSTQGKIASDLQASANRGAGQTSVMLSANATSAAASSIAAAAPGSSARSETWSQTRQGQANAEEIAPAANAAALGAASSLSTQGKVSSDPRSGANRAAAQSAVAPLASAAATATSPVAPAAPASSGQNETWSQKRPGQEDGQNAAPAANAVANGAASLASTAATASAMASIGPITMSQLADTLASQASALVSQSAPSDAAATGAASVTGAQPVKELEIQLDPSELGAVSVKMRLSDGKLSVVMEVSKPSTLKAVESDRDTIADRLGSSVQSLESLVIRSSTASQTAPDSNNAAGQKPEGRNNAQSDARGSGNSQGGQGAPRRDSSADSWSRQTPPREPVAGRGFGDMVV